MTPEMQETLTRVGPATPMGELLRRYWHPVAASSELDAGQTRPVRLLGEDLVLFRTSEGALGLLEDRCPHRGSALRCGVVDHEGIACPYHGWRFDRTGQCIGMPAEPRVRPRMLQSARARGFPVEELGGLVFAYLGPPPAPLLPRYDLYVWDGVLRDIGRAMIPCNWLQIMENSVDPTHVEWLHGHHLAAVRSRSGQSTPTHYRRHHLRIGFEVFDWGIVKRRVLEGGSEQDDDWVTGHPLIFPLTLRVGADRQHRFQLRVPVDDTTTAHFWYSCYRPAPGQMPVRQETVPVYEVPWRDATGDFILDFVDGGDIMAWVTQGAIADRTRERLVSSDRGIVLYRRLLLEQIEQVRAGRDPMGLIRDPRRNVCVPFAQEANKFRSGAAFLREAIELSHVRYSPLKERILQLLEAV
jgi:5,5'-dehydrodivanillate O-demethylase oxygenase subunit